MTSVLNHSTAKINVSSAVLNIATAKSKFIKRIRGLSSDDPIQPDRVARTIERVDRMSVEVTKAIAINKKKKIKYYKKYASTRH